MGSAVVEGNRKLSGSLILFMRALSSGPNVLSKAPPPNTNTLEIRFQYMNLGETQTFS